MKVWYVEEQTFIGGDWETTDWRYFSSREKAVSALRKHLTDFPEEVVNTSYENRVEDDIGFLMTLPKIEGKWRLRFFVDFDDFHELNEEFGD